MEVPEILEPEFDIHDNDKIIALARATQKSGIGFSELLNQRLTDLISINEIYRSSVLILKNHVIVSHGDLDQKNVLWDDSGNPLLIDWESAKKLNPTYEIVNAALDWSGITTHFDISIFIEMIKAYKAKGGIINKKIFESALHGVLGNWINWMAYNIHRAINGSTPEQKTLWVKQVNQTVETIFRLKAAIPELISFKLTI